jgi:hypothetical protein
MVGAALPEAIVGLLLVFFLPGYTLTKATFPEWRLRGPAAILRLIETLTLSLVLSVVLTVVVGYALLSTAPGGFQSFWTDPVLEAALAGVAAVGFVAGWVRGGYRREPPPRPAPEAPTGEDGAWELTRELEELGRQERRLNHLLRTQGSNPKDRIRLEEELGDLRARRDALQRRREGEYAS